MFIPNFQMLVRFNQNFIIDRKRIPISNPEHSLMNTFQLLFVLHLFKHFAQHFVLGNSIKENGRFNVKLSNSQ